MGGRIVTRDLGADESARKERQREVPYVQPSLKAVLQDALQWDSFRDFLALGIPGGFMMQLEGNSYDITTLLAGLLGTCPPHFTSSHVSLPVSCVISGV